MQHRSNDREKFCDSSRAPDLRRSGASSSASERILHTLVHDTANWLQRLQGILHQLEDRLPAGDPALQGLREGLSRCAELGEQAVHEVDSSPAPAPARAWLRQTVQDFLRDDEASRSGGVSLRLADDGTEEDVELALPAGVLQNALLNLVRNAREATGRSGEVLLEIACDREPPRLRVRDRGAGMDEDLLERCLEPGVRGPDSPGRGLGLASVVQALGRYGGTLHLESEPGVGTTAVLELPRAELSPIGREPDTTQRLPQALDVLVVDDEEPVREVLSVMLREMGHQVRGVDSARAAWAALAESAPDVVLLDQALPDVPGTDVAEAMRQENPDLKLVLLTGDASTLQADRRPGALDAIGVKPLGLEGLRSLLEDAFRDAQRRRSSDHRARPAQG